MTRREAWAHETARFQIEGSYVDQKRDWHYASPFEVLVSNIIEQCKLSSTKLIREHTAKSYETFSSYLLHGSYIEHVGEYVDSIITIDIRHSRIVPEERWDQLLEERE